MPSDFKTLLTNKYNFKKRTWVSEIKFQNRNIYLHDLFFFQQSKFSEKNIFINFFLLALTKKRSLALTNYSAPSVRSVCWPNSNTSNAREASELNCIWVLPLTILNCCIGLSHVLNSCCFPELAIKQMSCSPLRTSMTKVWSSKVQ